jgi:hypothetical protein
MNKKIFFLISLLALIFFILPVILGPKSLAAPLNECNYICPEKSDYYSLYPKPGSRTEDFKFDQSECIRVCLNDTEGNVVTDVKSAFIQWAQNNGFSQEAIDNVITTLKTPRQESTSSGSFFQFPNPLKIKTVGELLEAIINWLFWIALPLSVIFILYAAYLFITSGGKPEIIKKAKNTLIYTLIGFAIILLANSIPYLINEILSGHSNTNNTNQTEQSGQIPGARSEDEKINDCLDKCHDLENNETAYNDCLDNCLGF